MRLRIYLPRLVIQLARGIRVRIHRVRTIHTRSIIHRRLAHPQRILQVVHPVIQHTVDRATTRITLACIQRFMVRHLRRILTCTEDTLLLPHIPLIIIRRSRILRRPILTILFCRIRIRICRVSLSHPLNKEATCLRVILG